MYDLDYPHGLNDLRREVGATLQTLRGHNAIFINEVVPSSVANEGIAILKHSSAGNRQSVALKTRNLILELNRWLAINLHNEFQNKWE